MSKPYAKRRDVTGRWLLGRARANGKSPLGEGAWRAAGSAGLGWRARGDSALYIRGLRTLRRHTRSLLQTHQPLSTLSSIMKVLDKRAIYSSGLGYGAYPAVAGAALSGLGAYGAYPGYGAYSGHGAYPYAGAAAYPAAHAAAAYPAYSGYQGSLAYPGYTAGLRGYSG
ncbi:Protein of unknown function [Gryllus bimaculatus]|nr:Protein of unknown function [Gryllus bimaculatus]